jgi:hypothetical protein
MLKLCWSWIVYKYRAYARALEKIVACTHHDVVAQSAKSSGGVMEVVRQLPRFAVGELISRSFGIVSRIYWYQHHLKSIYTISLYYLPGVLVQTFIKCTCRIGQTKHIASF